MIEHAMVLDTFDENRNTLIFKNTSNDASSGHPKKIEMCRDDPNAPRELYFVHIDIRDMSSLPNQELRKQMKFEEIEANKIDYATVNYDLKRKSGSPLLMNPKIAKNK